MLVWKQDLDQRDQFIATTGQYIKSTTNEAVFELASVSGFEDVFCTSKAVMLEGLSDVLCSYESFFPLSVTFEDDIPSSILQIISILASKPGVNTFDSMSEMMGLMGECDHSECDSRLLTAVTCNTNEQIIIKPTFQDLDQSFIESIVLSTFLFDASDFQDRNIIIQYKPEIKKLALKLIDYND